MARLPEARRIHLEATLPPAETTRQRISDYMSKTDMTRLQFAKLMGYSAYALDAFIREVYVTDTRTDLTFREAAELAMERHPVGEIVVTSNGRLYETENSAVMRRWFEHCHKNRALAFVYAPPGSQKTFVAQHLVAEFNRRELGKDQGNRAFYIRASVNIQPRDLVAKICVEVGAPTGLSLQRCMAGLRQQLRGTKTVLILDEMQLAGIPALEALRELHDTDPRLGILLMGSHELKKFFDTRAAELEQWNSRLDAGVELTGVSDVCARTIVELELPDLDTDQVTAMLEGSRIADAYSRVRGRKYLNMRRLFKNITAYRQLSADAQEAAA